jgi:hypothetical protein
MNDDSSHDGDIIPQAQTQGQSKTVRFLRTYTSDDAPLDQSLTPAVHPVSRVEPPSPIPSPPRPSPNYNESTHGIDAPFQQVPTIPMLPPGPFPQNLSGPHLNGPFGPAQGGT